MVAAGLALLALGLIYRLLGPAFSMSSRTTIRSELYQRGFQALKILALDLQNSAADGVVVAPTSPTRTLLGVHPLKDANTEGKRVWSDSYVIHLWEEERLTRLVHQDPSPQFQERAQRPTTVELGNFLIAPVSSKILAYGVAGFSVSDSDPAANRLEMPYLVRLELRADVHGKTDPESVTLTRAITPRN